MEAVSVEGIGPLLREARIAKGYSLEGLARELHWRVDLLQAVEEERWEAIPPGQERPMVRQMAARLELGLEACPDAWDTVPGEVEPDPPDPRQLRLERIVSTVLAAGSILVLAWLLVPGRDLKQGPRRPDRKPTTAGATAPAPGSPAGPYPVLGEAIPEAPITEEGILVILRAIDVCTARIEAGDQRMEQVLRISEPWRVRVRGPFTLSLDNAGVVVVEVAGRPVRHDRHVGETWSGNFDILGQWILPPVPEVKPDTLAPEPIPD